MQPFLHADGRQCQIPFAPAAHHRIRPRVAAASADASSLPGGARAEPQPASGGRQSFSTLTPRGRAALTRKVQAHPLKASAETFTPALTPWAAATFHHSPVTFPLAATSTDGDYGQEQDVFPPTKADGGQVLTSQVRSNIDAEPLQLRNLDCVSVALSQGAPSPKICGSGGGRSRSTSSTSGRRPILPSDPTLAETRQ